MQSVGQGDGDSVPLVHVVTPCNPSWNRSYRSPYNQFLPEPIQSPARLSRLRQKPPASRGTNLPGRTAASIEEAWWAVVTGPEPGRGSAWSCLPTTNRHSWANVYSLWPVRTCL